MLLGVAGFVRGDWLNVTAQEVQTVADHGFVSALLTISDPSLGDDGDTDKIKSLYADHGLLMPMTRGAYGGGLCSDDDATREWTVRFLEDTVRRSAKMTCPTTYFRPGSLNPNGAWLPHPKNRSQATFDRLVESAKRACAVAESEGVKLVVEAGVVCPLYTPQRVRGILRCGRYARIGLQHGSGESRRLAGNRLRHNIAHQRVRRFDER